MPNWTDDGDDGDDCPPDTRGQPTAPMTPQELAAAIAEERRILASEPIDDMLRDLVAQGLITSVDGHVIKANELCNPHKPEAVASGLLWHMQLACTLLDEANRYAAIIEECKREGRTPPVGWVLHEADARRQYNEQVEAALVVARMSPGAVR